MPATLSEIPYDVFISYSHADSDWVFEWLVPRLKVADLKVCTDQESFAVGIPALINMENAVATSRHTLLVLTPAYLMSEWTMYEQILTQTQDPIGLRQRTIPVLRGPCDLPMRIAMLTYADLTGRRDAEAELAKIVRAIGGAPRPSQASQPKIQPPAPPAPVQPAFNTAAVRELLMAAFSDEELATFCFDNFRPVYEEFVAGMSRTQKVQLLVAYCERRGEMAKLLAQVEYVNPYQYVRLEARLGSTEPKPPKPSDTTPQTSDMLQQRRQRIAAWRKAVEAERYDFVDCRSTFLSSVVYSSLRPHLLPEAIEVIEAPRRVYVGGARGNNVRQYTLLDEITRIEREWGLV
jgi:hypothetical protein